MSMPLVSIIVPVYNCQQFLPDCLDSLLHQNLPSFEIICINDGSTDGSAEILEEYAHIYPEIRVITQENAGVSAARNRGLSLARGKYVCFCDSDDLLMEGILNQALAAMEAWNGQLCYYEMQRVPEEYVYCREPVETAFPLSIGLDAEVLKNLYVFLVLISRELLTANGISFQEGLAYSEDELFVIDLLRSAKEEAVLHLHGCGYLHRKNSGSVMNAAKHRRAPRHYDAMRTFGKELGSRSSEQALVCGEILRRKRQAASNALYDGFYMDKAPEEILEELTRDGLYPYTLCRETLRPSDFKTTVSNYVRFLFPVRGYYRLMCRVIRLGLKLLEKE